MSLLLGSHDCTSHSIGVWLEILWLPFKVFDRVVGRSSLCIWDPLVSKQRSAFPWWRNDPSWNCSNMRVCRPNLDFFRANALLITRRGRISHQFRKGGKGRRSPRCFRNARRNWLRNLMNDPGTRRIVRFQPGTLAQVWSFPKVRPTGQLRRVGHRRGRLPGR